MAYQILSKEILDQVKEKISETTTEYVEIVPGFKARVIQISAEAGFELVAQIQPDDDSDKEANKNEKFGENTYRWICACVVDAESKPVFEIEDLKQLPFKVVQDLARTVNKLNGLASPENIEDAEKN